MLDFEEATDTETSVTINLEYRTAKISKEYSYNLNNYKLLTL